MHRPKSSRKRLPTFTEQKVTASDGTANTFFGSAATIKRTTAVIGADGDASFRGSAYVFNKTEDIWTEGQQLVPSDGLAGDEFGYRVHSLTTATCS